MQIGEGGFGKVFIAQHVQSDRYRPKQWAVKFTSPTIFDTRSAPAPLDSYDRIEKRCQEIKTLLRLREARNLPVLYLHEYFWTYDQRHGKHRLFLVTELLGQQVDKWLQENPVSHESTVQQISLTLINALAFIHEKGVVHRDIKLQNVLFRRNGDFKTLKIVDFGLAKVLDGEQANEFCGSLGYISPEMYLDQPYGYEVDMFAMGGIIFRLLSGTRPFGSTKKTDANQRRLQRVTINLQYKIQGTVWENVSPEARNIVRKLLIGREERLTAEQALNHEWFKRQDEVSMLHPDRSEADGFKGNDTYTKAIIHSQAPAAPQAGSSTRFFLDSKLKLAVDILLDDGLYVGHIIECTPEEQGELICLEEALDSSMTTLPAHVAGLGSYTERECRKICREAALIVKRCQIGHMAHRNIHMDNFVVDKHVC